MRNLELVVPWSMAPTKEEPAVPFMIGTSCRAFSTSRGDFDVTREHWLKSFVWRDASAYSMTK